MKIQVILLSFLLYWDIVSSKPGLQKLGDHRTGKLSSGDGEQKSSVNEAGLNYRETRSVDEASSGTDWGGLFLDGTNEQETDERTHTNVEENTGDGRFKRSIWKSLNTGGATLNKEGSNMGKLFKSGHATVAETLSSGAAISKIIAQAKAESDAAKAAMYENKLKQSMFNKYNDLFSIGPSFDTAAFTRALYGPRVERFQSKSDRRKASRKLGDKTAMLSRKISTSRNDDRGSDESSNSESKSVVGKVVSNKRKLLRKENGNREIGNRGRKNHRSGWHVNQKKEMNSPWNRRLYRGYSNTRKREHGKHTKDYVIPNRRYGYNSKYDIFSPRYQENNDRGSNSRFLHRIDSSDDDEYENTGRRYLTYRDNEKKRTSTESSWKSSSDESFEKRNSEKLTYKKIPARGKTAKGRNKPYDGRSFWDKNRMLFDKVLDFDWDKSESFSKFDKDGKYDYKDTDVEFGKLYGKSEIDLRDRKTSSEKETVDYTAHKPKPLYGDYTLPRPEGIRIDRVNNERTASQEFANSRGIADYKKIDDNEYSNQRRQNIAGHASDMYRTVDKNGRKPWDLSNAKKKNRASYIENNIFGPRDRNIGDYKNKYENGNFGYQRLNGMQGRNAITDVGLKESNPHTRKHGDHTLESEHTNDSAEIDTRENNDEKYNKYRNTAEKSLHAHRERSKYDRDTKYRGYNGMKKISDAKTVKERTAARKIDSTEIHAKAHGESYTEDSEENNKWKSIILKKIQSRGNKKDLQTEETIDSLISSSETSTDDDDITNHGISDWMKTEKAISDSKEDIRMKWMSSDVSAEKNAKSSAENIKRILHKTEKVGIPRISQKDTHHDDGKRYDTFLAELENSSEEYIGKNNEEYAEASEEGQETHRELDDKESVVSSVSNSEERKHKRISNASKWKKEESISTRLNHDDVPFASVERKAGETSGKETNVLQDENKLHELHKKISHGVPPQKESLDIDQEDRTYTEDLSKQTEINVKHKLDNVEKEENRYVPDSLYEEVGHVALDTVDDQTSDLYNENSLEASIETEQSKQDYVVSTITSKETSMSNEDDEEDDDYYRKEKLMSSESAMARRRYDESNISRPDKRPKYSEVGHLKDTREIQELVNNIFREFTEGRSQSREHKVNYSQAKKERAKAKIKEKIQKSFAPRIEKYRVREDERKSPGRDLKEDLLSKVLTAANAAADASISVRDSSTTDVEPCAPEVEENKSNVHRKNEAHVSEVSSESDAQVVTGEKVNKGLPARDSSEHQTTGVSAVATAEAVAASSVFMEDDESSVARVKAYVTEARRTESDEVGLSDQNAAGAQSTANVETIGDTDVSRGIDEIDEGMKTDRTEERGRNAPGEVISSDSQGHGLSSVDDGEAIVRGEEKDEEEVENLYGAEEFALEEQKAIDVAVSLGDDELVAVKSQIDLRNNEEINAEAGDKSDELDISQADTWNIVNDDTGNDEYSIIEDIAGETEKVEDKIWSDVPNENYESENNESQITDQKNHVLKEDEADNVTRGSGVDLVSRESARDSERNDESSDVHVAEIEKEEMGLDSQNDILESDLLTNGKILDIITDSRPINHDKLADALNEVESRNIRRPEAAVPGSSTDQKSDLSDSETAGRNDVSDLELNEQSQKEDKRRADHPTNSVLFKEASADAQVTADNYVPVEYDEEMSGDTDDYERKNEGRAMSDLQNPYEQELHTDNVKDLTEISDKRDDVSEERKVQAEDDEIVSENLDTEGQPRFLSRDDVTDDSDYSLQRQEDNIVPDWVNSDYRSTGVTSAEADAGEIDEVHATQAESDLLSDLDRLIGDEMSAKISRPDAQVDAHISQAREQSVGVINDYEQENERSPHNELDTTVTDSKRDDKSDTLSAEDSEVSGIASTSKQEDDYGHPSSLLDQLSETLGNLKTKLLSNILGKSQEDHETAEIVNESDVSDENEETVHNLDENQISEALDTIGSDVIIDEVDKVKHKPVDELRERLKDSLSAELSAELSVTEDNAAEDLNDYKIQGKPSLTEIQENEIKDKIRSHLAEGDSSLSPSITYAPPYTHKETPIEHDRLIDTTSTENRANEYKADTEENENSNENPIQGETGIGDNQIAEISSQIVENNWSPLGTDEVYASEEGKEDEAELIETNESGVQSIADALGDTSTVTQYDELIIGDDDELIIDDVDELIAEYEDQLITEDSKMRVKTEEELESEIKEDADQMNVSVANDNDTSEKLSAIDAEDIDDTDASVNHDELIADSHINVEKGEDNKIVIHDSTSELIPENLPAASLQKVDLSDNEESHEYSNEDLHGNDVENDKTSAERGDTSRTLPPANIQAIVNSDAREDQDEFSTPDIPTHDRNREEDKTVANGRDKTENSKPPDSNDVKSASESGKFKDDIFSPTNGNTQSEDETQSDDSDKDHVSLSAAGSRLDSDANKETDNLIDADVEWYANNDENGQYRTLAGNDEDLMGMEKNIGADEVPHLATEHAHVPLATATGQATAANDVLNERIILSDDEGYEESARTNDSLERDLNEGRISKELSTAQAIAEASAAEENEEYPEYDGVDQNSDHSSRDLDAMNMNNVADVHKLQRPHQKYIDNYRNDKSLADTLNEGDWSNQLPIEYATAEESDENNDTSAEDREDDESSNENWYGPTLEDVKDKLRPHDLIESRETNAWDVEDSDKMNNYNPLGKTYHPWIEDDQDEEYSHADEIEKMDLHVGLELKRPNIIDENAVSEMIDDESIVDLELAKSSLNEHPANTEQMSDASVTADSHADSTDSQQKDKPYKGKVKTGRHPLAHGNLDKDSSQSNSDESDYVGKLPNLSETPMVKFGGDTSLRDLNADQNQLTELLPPEHVESRDESLGNNEMSNLINLDERLSDLYDLDLEQKVDASSIADVERDILKEKPGSSYIDTEADELRLNQQSDELSVPDNMWDTLRDKPWTSYADAQADALSVARENNELPRIDDVWDTLEGKPWTSDANAQANVLSLSEELDELSSPDNVWDTLERKPWTSHADAQADALGLNQEPNEHSVPDNVWDTLRDKPWSSHADAQADALGLNQEPNEHSVPDNVWDTLRDKPWTSHADAQADALGLNQEPNEHSVPDNVWDTLRDKPWTSHADAQADALGLNQEPNEHSVPDNVWDTLRDKPWTSHADAQADALGLNQEPNEHSVPDNVWDTLRDKPWTSHADAQADALGLNQEPNEHSVPDNVWDTLRDKPWTSHADVQADALGLNQEPNEHSVPDNVWDTLRDKPWTSHADAQADALSVARENNELPRIGDVWDTLEDKPWTSDANAQADVLSLSEELDELSTPDNVWDTLERKPWTSDANAQADVLSLSEELDELPTPDNVWDALGRKPWNSHADAQADVSSVLRESDELPITDDEWNTLRGKPWTSHADAQADVSSVPRESDELPITDHEWDTLEDKPWTSHADAQADISSVPRESGELPITDHEWNTLEDNPWTSDANAQANVLNLSEELDELPSPDNVWDALGRKPWNSHADAHADVSSVSRESDELPITDDEWNTLRGKPWASDADAQAYDEILKHPLSHHLRNDRLPEMLSKLSDVASGIMNSDMDDFLPENNDIYQPNSDENDIVSNVVDAHAMNLNENEDTSTLNNKHPNSNNKWNKLLIGADIEAEAENDELGLHNLRMNDSKEKGWPPVFAGEATDREDNKVNGYDSPYKSRPSSDISTQTSVNAVVPKKHGDLLPKVSGAQAINTAADKVSSHGLDHREPEENDESLSDENKHDRDKKHESGLPPKTNAEAIAKSTNKSPEYGSPNAATNNHEARHGEEILNDESEVYDSLENVENDLSDTANEDEYAEENESNVHRLVPHDLPEILSMEESESGIRANEDLSEKIEDVESELRDLYRDRKPKEIVEHHKAGKGINVHSESVSGDDEKYLSNQIRDNLGEYELDKSNDLEDLNEMNELNALHESMELIDDEIYEENSSDIETSAESESDYLGDYQGLNDRLKQIGNIAVELNTGDISEIINPDRIHESPNWIDEARREIEDDNETMEQTRAKTRPAQNIENNDSPAAGNRYIEEENDNDSNNVDTLLLDVSATNVEDDVGESDVEYNEATGASGEAHVSEVDEQKITPPVWNLGQASEADVIGEAVSSGQDSEGSDYAAGTGLDRLAEGDESGMSSGKNGQAINGEDVSGEYNKLSSRPGKTDEYDREASAAPSLNGKNDGKTQARADGAASAGDVSYEKQKDTSPEAIRAYNKKMEEYETSLDDLSLEEKSKKLDVARARAEAVRDMLDERYDLSVENDKVDESWDDRDQQMYGLNDYMDSDRRNQYDHRPPYRDYVPEESSSSAQAIADANVFVGQEELLPHGRWTPRERGRENYDREYDSSNEYDNRELHRKDTRPANDEHPIERENDRSWEMDNNYVAGQYERELAENALDNINKDISGTYGELSQLSDKERALKKLNDELSKENISNRGSLENDESYIASIEHYEDDLADDNSWNENILSGERESDKKYEENENLDKSSAEEYVSQMESRNWMEDDNPIKSKKPWLESDSDESEKHRDKENDDEIRKHWERDDNDVYGKHLAKDDNESSDKQWMKNNRDTKELRSNTPNDRHIENTEEDDTLESVSLINNDATNEIENKKHERKLDTIQRETDNDAWKKSHALIRMLGKRKDLYDEYADNSAARIKDRWSWWKRANSRENSEEWRKEKLAVSANARSNIDLRQDTEYDLSSEREAAVNLKSKYSSYAENEADVKEASESELGKTMDHDTRIYDRRRDKTSEEEASVTKRERYSDSLAVAESTSHSGHNENRGKYNSQEKYNSRKEMARKKIGKERHEGVSLGMVAAERAQKYNRHAHERNGESLDLAAMLLPRLLVETNDYNLRYRKPEDSFGSELYGRERSYNKEKYETDELSKLSAESEALSGTKYETVPKTSELSRGYYEKENQGNSYAREKESNELEDVAYMSYEGKEDKSTDISRTTGRGNVHPKRDRLNGKYPDISSVLAASENINDNINDINSQALREHSEADDSNENIIRNRPISDVKQNMFNTESDNSYDDNHSDILSTPIRKPNFYIDNNGREINHNKPILKIKSYDDNEGEYEHNSGTMGESEENSATESHDDLEDIYNRNRPKMIRNKPHRRLKPYSNNEEEYEDNSRSLSESEEDSATESHDDLNDIYNGKPPKMIRNKPHRRLKPYSDNEGEYEDESRRLSESEEDSATESHDDLDDIYNRNPPKMNRNKPHRKPKVYSDNENENEDESRNVSESDENSAPKPYERFENFYLENKEPKVIPKEPLFRIKPFFTYDKENKDDARSASGSHKKLGSPDDDRSNTENSASDEKHSKYIAIDGDTINTLKAVARDKLRDAFSSSEFNDWPWQSIPPSNAEVHRQYTNMDRLDIDDREHLDHLRDDGREKLRFGDLPPYFLRRKSPSAAAEDMSDKHQGKDVSDKLHGEVHPLVWKSEKPDTAPGDISTDVKCSDALNEQDGTGDSGSGSACPPDVPDKPKTDIYVVKRRCEGPVKITRMRNTVPPLVTHRLIPRKIYDRVREILAGNHVSYVTNPENRLT